MPFIYTGEDRWSWFVPAQGTSWIVEFTVV